MSTKIKDKTELRREFGRVVSHPDKHNGAPFLNGTTVTVAEVLDMIEQGNTDQQIIDHFNNIKQLHIDLCRAYQARFLSHTNPDFKHVDENDKALMLDENISHLILHDVVRLFGWSSHVLADGLYDDNNDDLNDIWAHMKQEKYKAILTSDTDFKKIARNNWRSLTEEFGNVANSNVHVPGVIHVSSNLSNKGLKKLLNKNKDAIIEYMNNPQAPFVSMTRSEFRPIPFTANDNKPNNKPEKTQKPPQPQ